MRIDNEDVAKLLLKLITREIDLSPENVAKTKIIHKKVKYYKPKYKTMEIVFSDEEGKNMKLSKGYMSWNEVVKKYGDRMIWSARDYEDTKTTSLLIERYEYD